MGQLHAKMLEAEQHKRELEEEKAALAEAERLLAERNGVPRDLRDQVQNILRPAIAGYNNNNNNNSVQPQQQQANPQTPPEENEDGILSLQGFQFRLVAAQYAVAFLTLAQQVKFAQRANNNAAVITGLALEREITDVASLQLLVHFLQQQGEIAMAAAAADNSAQKLQLQHKDNHEPSPSQQPCQQATPPLPVPQILQIDRLTMSLCSFGVSPEARENCRALLKSKHNWKCIDLQHCNFVYEEDDEGKKTTDMTYLTDGLAHQRELQEFKFGHGIMSDVPAVGDAELAPVLEALIPQKQTLRALSVRDQYDCSGNTGAATSQALLNLLQCSQHCPSNLDCRLEKLLWDIPCTHNLYQEGSELQVRFFAAILHNSTLQTVRLRRLNLSSPLVKKVKDCTVRNQWIAKVRQTFVETGNNNPSLLRGLLGVALCKLATQRQRALDELARQGSTERPKKQVRFEPRPTYLEYKTDDPVAMGLTRTLAQRADQMATPLSAVVVDRQASAMFLALQATLGGNSGKM